jgi:mRNA-degrading endonuclease RelE of RelBE toxin-antitoxin system
MYSIIFHPEADKEFSEAILWYKKQKEGLGNGFFLSVETIIKLIQSRPETFGYSRKPFREALVTFFPYTIVYKIHKRKQAIYISAVYHTSRNPHKKFRR